MQQTILVSCGTFLVLLAMLYVFRNPILIHLGLRREHLTPELLQEMAKRGAAYLKKYFWYAIDPDNPPIGIVLGTGFGDKLTFVCQRGVSFSKVPGFGRLNHIPGHDRKFMFGYIEGKPVIALKGRIHLNENMCYPEIDLMVRLQTQILMEFGIQHLIVTCAAGALPGSDFEPGNLVVVDSYLTVFAPRMPLLAGEFCSPEDTLAKLHCAAKECLKPLSKRFDPTRNAETPKGGVKGQGCYAMVAGPFFEGRKKDKMALCRAGAELVGMSSLPEACVAALYGCPVVQLAFVTNGWSEAHLHESNQDKAAEYADALRDALEALVVADLHQAKSRLL